MGALYLTLGGWALHYLPFAFVARDCFLTYYILAAYFALLTLTIVLDLLFGGRGGGGRAVASGATAGGSNGSSAAGGSNGSTGATAAGGVAMGALGFCAVCMFLYLAPLSYADDAMPSQYFARVSYKTQSLPSLLCV